MLLTKTDRTRPRRRGLERSQYHAYITSDIWRAKHAGWLKQADHRCSMFPWVRVGSYYQDGRRRYGPYRMNHMHYNTLGHEQYWLDVLPLCAWADRWIYHGVLGGFQSAGKQKRFPNAPQRIANHWCRVPAEAKFAVLGTVGAIALLCLLKLLTVVL